MTVDSLIINIIEKFFDTFRIKYSRHEKIYMLLLRYFNLRLKYIVLTPREIRVSEELSGKLSTHLLKSIKGTALYRLKMNHLRGTELLVKLEAKGLRELNLRMFWFVSKHNQKTLLFL